MLNDQVGSDNRSGALCAIRARTRGEDPESTSGQEDPSLGLGSCGFVM